MTFGGLNFKKQIQVLVIFNKMESQVTQHVTTDGKLSNKLHQFLYFWEETKHKSISV